VGCFAVIVDAVNYCDTRHDTRKHELALAAGVATPEKIADSQT